MFLLPSVPPLRGCTLGYWLTPADAGSTFRKIAIYCSIEVPIYHYGQSKIRRGQAADYYAE